ncbi:unnamed protein product [Rodentolepis nana]|uniref:Uncharacterized protein n=1 Tax=Rodentolepis nana TaxID=102285 RepID=A0A3P7T2L9_RODNA|nr:unnamed protein product [Rodentolepis nana]
MVRMSNENTGRLVLGVREVFANPHDELFWAALGSTEATD